ncbi:MAG: radical SAM protein [Alphaproteobacteria bacterium]|nr:radical SAM protein [Alphaproteobacteria bacterium]
MKKGLLTIPFPGLLEVPLVLPGSFEVVVAEEHAFVRFDGLTVRGADSSTIFSITISTADGKTLQALTDHPANEPFGARLNDVSVPGVLRIEVKRTVTGRDPSQTNVGGDALPCCEEVSLTNVSLVDSIDDFVVSPLKCYWPFSLMSIIVDGGMYPCQCGVFLNNQFRYGEVRSTDVMTAWNGPAMQDMRKAFYAEEYGRHCRTNVCPVLNGEMNWPLPSVSIIRQINDGQTVLKTPPENLVHMIDYGCNLACTMCRKEKILPSPINIDHAMHDLDEILRLGTLKTFHTSGTGEPLMFKPFVERLKSDYFSSREIQIGMNTNLICFSEKLFERVQHNHWERISVSADGCTKETYESIRRGAKWKVFERNLRALSRFRKEGKVKVIKWNWVILRNNVHELDKAILFVKELGFDQILFVLQRGKKNDDNIFEECDLTALDIAYEKIDSVGGFDLPYVSLGSANCLRNRRYKTLNFLLSMAQYRHGEGEQLSHTREQVRRAFSLLQNGLIEANTPLVPNVINFLKRLGLYKEAVEAIPKDMLAAALL